jgi:putative membrane protein insertion efficiency factor
MVHISGGGGQPDWSQKVPPPQVIEEEQKKDRSWDDCLPDCGDCGSPSCSCDLPGCDLGLMILSSLALGRLFRLGGRSGTRPAGRRPVRPPRTRPTAPGRVGMAAIRGYQRWLSPRLRTRCRHTPHCSAYGMEAVRRYGLLTGTQLTADRIRRCTAPTPHGTNDPVP